MAGTIEKQDISRRTLIISGEEDGTLSLRYDYILVTSEGDIARSRLYAPTVTQQNSIKSLLAAILSSTKSQESIA